MVRFRQLGQYLEAIFTKYVTTALQLSVRRAGQTNPTKHRNILLMLIRCCGPNGLQDADFHREVQVSVLKGDGRDQKECGKYKKGKANQVGEVIYCRNTVKNVLV